MTVIFLLMLIVWGGCGIFLLFALKFLSDARWLKKEGRKAPGEILQLREGGSAFTGGAMYLVVFRYQVGEQEYTCRQFIPGAVYFSWKKDPPRDFQVTYRASHPQKAYITEKVPLFMSLVMLFCAFLFFFLAMVFLVILTRSSS